MKPTDPFTEDEKSFIHAMRIAQNNCNDGKPGVLGGNVRFCHKIPDDDGIKSCEVATLETMMMFERDGFVYRDLACVYISTLWYLSIACKVSHLNWLLDDVHKDGPSKWIEKQIQSYTDSVRLTTHSLTHSLTHSFIHSLTHSFTHFLTIQLTN